MNNRNIKLVGYLTAFLFTLPVQVRASDFATEVVSYKGSFGISPYDDPNSVLGKPTTWIFDVWSGGTYACSLPYPAWSTDPNGNKLITTILDGDEIVVKFDHKVADDAGNPYGIDFIVFGNSFFATGWVYPDEDMEQCIISFLGTEEPVLISVAQHPTGPWYTFADGPYGDTAFPTNAFVWDHVANDWGQELDWLRPVDPNLSLSAFENISVAGAIQLYAGSAGGTGFDLKWLAPNDYQALEVDPNSGRKWIQYIKVEYLAGSYYPGEIDAVSDVSCCGDYKHPIVVGDLNKDCRVDFFDFAILAQDWLVASGWNDLAGLAGNWLYCNWECE